jgi:capsular polysaccharide biosynthesis protein
LRGQFTTRMLSKLTKKDILLYLKYLDYTLIQRARHRLGLRKKNWTPVKFYKTKWLEQADAHKIAKIRYSRGTFSVGPCILRQSSERKKITLPPIYQYTFNNSVSFNISTSIFLNKNHLLIERVHEVSTQRCNYPTGPNEIRGNQLAAFPRKQSINYEEGIFLGGNGASNYYHWLIEILPKMEFVNELGKEYSEYPLLVSESVKKIPSFQDALKFLVGGRSIIYLDDRKYFTVKNLVVFTTPSNIPFNLIENETPRIEDFRINASSIHYLRKNILAKYVSPKVRNKRLFLTIENPRREYNEDEVFEIFKHYGFEKVYVEKLSFEQQVNLMQQAEMLAGATGAAWTNLLFCEPGVKCICWMNEFISKFSAFSNIAHIVGANLTYILYQSLSKSTADCYAAPYTLNLNQVKATLQNLVINNERSFPKNDTPKGQ